jgi:hypothetical protein
MASSQGRDIFDRLSEGDPTAGATALGLTSVGWTALAVGNGVACAVAVLLGMKWSNSSPWFLLHPVCNALGVAVVMVAAIGVHHGVPRAVPRAKLVRVHRIAIYIALASLALGGVGILGSKLSQGKSIIPHNLHSWAGLTVLVLVLLQAVVAVMAEPPAWLRAMHSRLGEAITAGGLLSIVLGQAKLMGWGDFSTVVCAVTAMAAFGALEMSLILGRGSKVAPGPDPVAGS